MIDGQMVTMIDTGRIDDATLFTPRSYQVRCAVWAGAEDSEVSHEPTTPTRNDDSCHPSSAIIYLIVVSLKSILPPPLRF
jgi:hypothetical protein